MIETPKHRVGHRECLVGLDAGLDGCWGARQPVRPVRCVEGIDRRWRIQRFGCCRGWSLMSILVLIPGFVLLLSSYIVHTYKRYDCCCCCCSYCWWWYFCMDERTNVVFPTPWIPLIPRKNGGGGILSACFCRWMRSLSVINGIQCWDLSSTIFFDMVVG